MSGARPQLAAAAVATALMAGVAAAQVPLPPDAALLLRADSPLRRAAADPRTTRLSLRATPAGDTLAEVFIRADRGAESRLRSAGARIGTRAGGWIVARVPVDQLATVAATRGVRGVEMSGRARFHLDSAMADVGAASVRSNIGLDIFTDHTGRGAIVGIVDSGIDHRHPDFVEEGTERSRIVYLWDQTMEGVGPGRVGTTDFSYGVECVRATMGPGRGCASRDREGHGTHVAGIAASDGSRRRSDRSFPGVAPGAELIVVNTTLSLASIVEGVDYIFQRAQELGRPAVVNLSIGSNLGPHDGQEAASLMIDALSGPGRIVVASAGNAGNNRNGAPAGVFPSLHAETLVPVGGSADLTFRVATYSPTPGTNNDLVLIQAYYDPADRYTVTVIRPNGRTVTVDTTGMVVQGNVAGGVALYNGTQAGDSVLGQAMELGWFAPASPSRVVELFAGEWIAGGAPPFAGEWRMRFTRVSGTGSGRIDAYVADHTMTTEPTFELGATNRALIGAPGSARSAITVAAYSTRTGWRSIDGATYVVNAADSVATGDLLLFSSPGPTRDGRRKPDIAAPGRMLSSLSKDATVPRPLVADDSAHWALEGTSMAAPMVTGAVALLLALNPSLGPDDVRAALTRGARQDAFTQRSYAAGDPPVGLPNSSWGYGKLDLPRAIAEVSPAAGRGYLAVNAPPAGTFPSRRGTVLPLQRLRLSAMDAEALAVEQITIIARGADPGARLGLVVDADHDGVPGPDEEIHLAAEPTPLTATPQQHVIRPEGLVIPAGAAIDAILVARLSGATPHASSFSAEVPTNGGITRGVRTGARRTLDGEHAPAAAVATTVLSAGERVAISANPVRGRQLVLTYASDANRIDVFDLVGRRVWSTLPASGDRRTVWDLTDAAGRPVPNGAYFVVMNVDGVLERRRVLVAR